MSAKENLEGYYAATAYTPSLRQQWEEAHPKRDKMFGTRLSWDRKTQDNGPREHYDYSYIEISEKEEQRCQNNVIAENKVFEFLKARYDHQAIIPPNYKPSAKLLFMAISISKGGTFLCLFIFFSMIIMTAIKAPFSNETLMEDIHFVWVFFLYIAPFAITFSSVWGTLAFFHIKRPDIFLGTRKGPIWEANRQTGLFTLYHPKHPWKQRLQVPFYEFDAFLQSSPDTQGSSTYSLFLYHPRTFDKQKLNALFPPTKMQGELIAAWQFLQRYMDVSQPLPDVPALEIHRHKDPTTAAVDKRKQRNPRYWRDMDEESVKKIQETKYRKNIRLR